MLLDKDAGGQRLGRVVIVHRDGRLQHDRAGIELGVHEMDRDSGDFDAVRPRLPLRIRAGKRGQQRRMDIQDGVGKPVQHLVAQQIA